MKNKNIQVNIAIPENWKPQLEKLARVFSFEEDHDYSFHDLIRKAVKDKYKLREVEKDENK